MSELQNLVPPLEICKRIPQGSFTDSFFCWVDYSKAGWVRSWRNITVSYDEPFIITPRFSAESLIFHRAECPQDKIPAVIYPAPTLQEIMDDLAEYGEPVTVTQWKTGQIAVSCQINDDVFEEVSQDGASAALKLWLEIYNQ